MSENSNQSDDTGDKPDQWFQEYLSEFQLHDNSSATIRPHVPEFWTDFCRHLKPTYHSKKRIETAALYYGFGRVKEQYPHRILMEHAADMSRSKLEGDRYSQLPSFDTNSENKCPDRTSNIPVSENVLRDLSNYERFLECSRSELVRHLFYHAILYYNEQTYSGEKFTGIIEHIEERVNQFEEDLERRISWIKSGSIPLDEKGSTDGKMTDQEMKDTLLNEVFDLIDSDFEDEGGIPESTIMDMGTDEGLNEGEVRHALYQLVSDGEVKKNQTDSAIRYALRTE